MNKQITVADVLRGIGDNMRGGAEAAQFGGIVADRYTVFLHQVDYDRFHEQEAEIQVQARQHLDKALRSLNKKSRWQARVSLWGKKSDKPHYQHRGERWMVSIKEASGAGRHVPPGGLLIESQLQFEHQNRAREKVVTTLKSAGVENTSVAYHELASQKSQIASRAPLPQSDPSDWAPKPQGESQPFPKDDPEDARDALPEVSKPVQAPIPPSPSPSTPESSSEELTPVVVRRKIVEALRMVGEKVEVPPEPPSKARISEQESAAPSYTHHQILAPAPAKHPSVSVEVEPDPEPDPDEQMVLHPDRKRRKQSLPAPIPVAKVIYRNDEDEHLLYMRKPEIAIGTGVEAAVDVPLGEKRGVGGDHLHLRHNPVTGRIEVCCTTSRKITFRGAEEYAGGSATSVTAGDGWVPLPEKAFIFVGEAAPIMVEVLKVEF